MKKFLIVIMVIVVALGLSTAFYPNAVEVKTPVQKDVWNRAGSGFELSSVRAMVEVKAPVQRVWNWAGSSFELSSVRTAAEIKASIQKYWWNQAGSGFELTSVPNALPTSDQK